MGECITPQVVQGMIPALGQILVSDTLETAAKFHAIVAIGDIALASEQEFFNYLPQLMEAFLTASKASLATSTDESVNENLKNLRESLIDGYISVVHGMQDKIQAY